MPSLKSAEPIEIFGQGYVTGDYFSKFLKEREFVFSKETSECLNPSSIIVFNKPSQLALKKVLSIPKEKRILVILEPPSVLRTLHDKKLHTIFGKVLTWDDSTVDGKLYHKVHYPVLREIMESRPAFKEKKLCCSVSANKRSKWPGQLYSERRRAIEFFSREKGFDMYGVGWEDENIKSYLGKVDDKLGCMSKYRFSICYENTSDSFGYVTEKIFDSFAAGCVPVYLGAPNIEEYIPQDCFIDKRKFSSYEQLYSFLKRMTEEEYNGYIENIERYLKSEQILKKA